MPACIHDRGGGRGSMDERETTDELLSRALQRPELFSAYTADLLWTDPHISEQMQRFHLDGESALSSRPFSVIARSVRWLDDRFGLGSGARVLDLGCGPGLYTSRMAALGAEVTGLDFSSRSIDWARAEAERTGTRVRYVHGSYLDALPEGPFDLVSLIMCDYCALSPEQRSALLARIRSALAPQGRFAFDVYSLAALAALDEEIECAEGLLGGFFSAAPYVGIRARFLYAQARVSLDQYTIVEAAGVRRLFNWLAYFDAASLEAELAACGFRLVETVGSLAGDDFDEASPEFAVVAQAR